MTEFDEYLQLGNELEQENNILMAYAAYYEAIKRGTGEQKQIIENYLKMLIEKITKDKSERNQQLKSQLLKWIEEEKISYAISCFSNILTMNKIAWIDDENAILYRCLNIYQMEQNCSITSLELKGKEIKELKRWYNALRFMVRRVDMDIYEEEEIVEFVKRENVSMVALYYMATTMCIFFNRTCENFIKIFSKYAMEDYVMFFKEICKEKERNIREEHYMVHKISCEYKAEKKEKIAFIMAVNEEEMYEESVYYINHLNIPDNIEMEIIPVRGASSLTSAYNQGMQLTNARYKVYMHQDTRFINPYVIHEMMNLFQNKEIGMIGVAGAEKLPKSGVWWSKLGNEDENETSEVYMKLYQADFWDRIISDKGGFLGDYARVEVLDGVMMATQYDIPWREDIFTGWHFYDISQCMEFNRKNLKVVVAAQQNMWCLHEGKTRIMDWESYQNERKKCIQEYIEKNDS